MKQLLLILTILALFVMTGCDGVNSVNESDFQGDDVETSALGFSKGGNSLPMVTGSGHFVDSRLNWVPDYRTFSFTAIGKRDGSASGQWQLNNRAYPVGQDVGVRIHGTVECVSVAGNRAWFAGATTQSDDPERIGEVRGFLVVDNGQGDPPDQISFAHGPLSNAQGWCDRPLIPPLNDIENGNIQVR